MELVLVVALEAIRARAKIHGLPQNPLPTPVCVNLKHMFFEPEASVAYLHLCSGSGLWMLHYISFGKNAWLLGVWGRLDWVSVHFE